MGLSRDAILAADDLPRELVEVPEWGGSVWVGTMSGRDRDEFERLVTAGTENARARLALVCLQDDAGQRLFTPDDVAALGAKSSAALTRVAQVALRLNRLGDSAIEDAKGN